LGSYIVITSTTRYLLGYREDGNFKFASLESLSAGDHDHTLVINITQCLNHTFIFDYITYSPSFANLASMPSLAFTASASHSSPTTSQGPGQTTSQGPRQSAGSKVTLVGPAVGGAVGGLLALTLLTLWLRRRRMSKGNLVVPFDNLPKGAPREGAFLICIRFSYQIRLMSHRPPAVSSTRSPGDFASSSSANPIGIDLAMINPSSWVSVTNSAIQSVGPPAYEAIVVPPRPP
jgi:hypothetical protein